MALLNSVTEGGLGDPKTQLVYELLVGSLFPVHILPPEMPQSTFSKCMRKEEDG